MPPTRGVRSSTMRKERGEHSSAESEDREALRNVFEDICDRAREVFVRDGAHAPLLLVLTRLGLAVARIDMDPAVDREPIARMIRESITKTPITGGDRPDYDEPLAVILASEAWMVEYDEREAEETAKLPPRLHPRRKEILQVTLRSKIASFSRNWPIVREGENVTIGEAKDLGGEGMESVWDIILTG
jgi:hypothetical protein